MGAELIRQVLLKPGTEHLLEPALADNDADSLATAFRLLEDIGQERPALWVPALDTLLAQDIEARGLPALLAATRWKEKSRTHLIADRLLVRLKSGVRFELLHQLHDALSPQSLALAELALWVTDEILKQPSLSSEVTAEHLLNKGIRFNALGRREEALQATQEAVVIRRQLAAQTPDAFNPDLARSLSNLGRWLSELERREEALAASREAVDILTPYLLQLPQAHGQEWLRNARSLRKRLQEAGISPTSDPQLQFYMEMLDQLEAQETPS
ncbi:MAG: tetratricopeptide repeat protein [Myxococcota bacterium]